MALLTLLAVLVPPAPCAGPDPALTSVRALGTAFADVAERVGPTAVYIQAEKGAAMTAGLQELAQDFALPDLAGPSASAMTSGSGVVIRADGLVITNHHVVAGATRIRVTLQDKRQFPARLVGSDARTDVAVLQIEGAGPFATAVVGDSDDLRVGEWVLAVGHPFDFQFTVTAGIVSARGRRNLARDEIQDYIQTDAAVNPGSSGGPLFDLEGRLVGINTAIYSPGARDGNAQNAGISFAIPVNMARRVADELLDSGKVGRPGVGIVVADWPASAEDPVPGAEVTRVVPSGPGEAAGLLRGDVILSVDGEPIAGAEDLRGIVRAKGVGVPLNVAFVRAGAKRQVVVTTWDDAAVGTSEVPPPIHGKRWAGLTLVEASPAALSPFGVSMPPREVAGVLVAAVQPGSPGDDAGLAAGDVILKVGNEDVRDVGHMLAVVKGRKSALVVIWRGQGAAYAALAGIE